MPEIKTQRQAIEALAQWIVGPEIEVSGYDRSEAREVYLSLMRENVAASERHEWHLTDQVKHAVKLTHATIAALEVDE